MTTTPPSDAIAQWRRHQRRRRMLALLVLIASAAAAYEVWNRSRSEPVYRLLYLPRLGDAEPDDAEKPAHAPARRSVRPQAPEDWGDSGDSGVAWTLDEQRLGVVEAAQAARAAGARCGGVWHEPAGPLWIDRALQQAAQAQAEWMVEADDFAHQTPDNPAGATPMARAARAGFSGATVGENLAWGQRSPDDAVDWWEDSPAHCRVLMAAELASAGVGVVADPSGGWVWVLLLGGG